MTSMFRMKVDSRTWRDCSALSAIILTNNVLIHIILFAPESESCRFRNERASFLRNLFFKEIQIKEAIERELARKAIQKSDIKTKQIIRVKWHVNKSGPPMATITLPGKLHENFCSSSKRSRLECRAHTSISLPIIFANVMLQLCFKGVVRYSSHTNINRMRSCSSRDNAASSFTMLYIEMKSTRKSCPNALSVAWLRIKILRVPAVILLPHIEIKWLMTWQRNVQSVAVLSQLSLLLSVRRAWLSEKSLPWHLSALVDVKYL